MHLLALVFAFPLGAQIVIDTVAGGASTDGLQALRAPLGYYTGSAVGPDGTVYFTAQYSVRAFGPDGVVRTIAGTGVSGFSGDGGPAIAARLWSPMGIVVDSEGNVIFGDQYRIRRVSPDGTITTIAGNGYPATSVTDGPALSTAVYPAWLAIDSSGAVYFAETSYNRIRRLNTDGTVSLVAGAPNFVSSDGDGGPAISAHLEPSALAIDGKGDVFVIDFNRLRMIAPNGIISTIAGAGIGPFQDGSSAHDAGFYSLSGIAMDSSGTIWLSGSENYSNAIWRITPDGLIYQFGTQSGAVFGVDSAANFYFQSGAIYRAAPSGTTVALTGSGTVSSPDGTPARNAFLNLRPPGGMALDAAGRVLLADGAGCRVRAVGNDGTLVTVAGTGQCASTAAAGPALTANLCHPTSIAGSAAGSIFVSCADGSAARVNAAGTANTVPVATPCYQLAADSKDSVYCLSTATSMTTVLRVASDGTKTSLGPIQSPTTRVNMLIDAITVAADDTLYALVTIPAVVQYQLYSWSGSTFTAVPGALFLDFQLFGATNWVAVDNKRTVYASDGFHLVRETGGQVSTLGMPLGFSGDGGPVQSARINDPGDLAVDGKGNLYVLDYDDERIRRISGSPPAAAPAISSGGIVNSASFIGGPVTAVELISIFGQNLSAVTGVYTLDDVAVDTVLASTRVLVDGEPVPVLSISPGQVNAIVPQYPPYTTASVQVEVDGVASAAVVLPVAPAMPGLFTSNGSGTGPGSIVNQDGTVNSAANPAARGTVVSLYGTGAGPLNPAPYDGYLDIALPLQLISGSVSVTIGGQSTSVPYAGGAPFLVAGVMQINAAIPQSAPPGAVDVVLKIGSQTANTVSVRVQ